MKNIKQIREHYDLVTEKENSDVNKLTSLIRAGLFDSKKLPLLKRALEKDPSKLTPVERKALLELLDSLMSEVLHSQQVYSKVKQNVRDLSESVTRDYLSKFDPRYEGITSEKELPSVIILKRKAIRIFPGRQKVGLYYSQSLDRYVSIPFGPGVPNMNESFDKIAQAGAKTADIEDDETDDIKKIARSARRESAVKRYLKMKYKNKSDRDIARKVYEKGRSARSDYLKSYDAPKKKGQMSNLTKGWVKGDIGTSEYIGAKVGSAIGKLFARKKKQPSASASQSPSTPTKKTSEKPTTTTPKTTAKSDTQPRTDNLSFPTKEKGTDVVYKKRYNFHPKSPGTGPQPVVKEEKLDEVAFVAPVIAAARVAAPVVGRAIASGVSKATRATTKSAKTGARNFGRYIRRKADAASNATDSNDNKNDNQQSQVPERKFTTPGEFRLKANVSSAKSQTQTGYEKRADAKLRQSLEKPISESIKMIAEGNYDSYELNIGENKITINTSIAKKLNSLYESLNSKNKKKLEKMLNEGDVVSFKKLLDFAVR